MTCAVNMYALCRVTLNLRYYPKDYVQEFMGEAMGFLLRNAAADQLMEGTKRVMLEVAKKPSSARKHGVSALLWHVMRGTSSRFHSKAATVLQILMSSTMFNTCIKYTQGSETIVEVVVSTFERLHESLEPNELILVSRFLHQKLLASIHEDRFLHYRCLLSILVSHVRLSIGCKIFGALFCGSEDKQSIFALMKMLVKTLITRFSQNNQEDLTFEVDQVLQLLLCVLEGLHSCGHALDIDQIVEDCSPLFVVKNSRLLNFVKELLLKEFNLTDGVRSSIISALDIMLETSEEEALYLMMCFLQRTYINRTQSNCLAVIIEDKLVKFRAYLCKKLSQWTHRIRGDMQDDSSSQILNKTDLALIWGSVRCCPHILDISESRSLLKDLIDELDHISSKESGHPKFIWQSLLGAALSSYFQLNLNDNSWSDERRKLLQVAMKHISSSQVLSAVSDFLDSALWSTFNASTAHEFFHTNLKEGTAREELMEKFSVNLCHPNKSIRVSTLKILCQYESESCELCMGDACLERRYANVIQILRSIEETPLSISTSRGIILLISKLEKSIAAEGLPEVHATLIFSGLLGVLHNRFMYLWNPTAECLTFLVRKYSRVLFDRFFLYLDQRQSSFSASIYQVKNGHSESGPNPCDLVESYSNYVTPKIDSTPCPKVLSLLLQTLQKMPDVVKSRPERVISLFLKFLGYNTDDTLPPVNGTNDGLRLGSFDQKLCKGKEWKALLKDWLNLLRMMQNLKAFDHSGFLKQVLLHRLLDNNCAETQLKVLECLFLWKDDFLLPYSQHLKNIISPKDLREELAKWSLSKEAGFIDEHHRLHLVPLVIHLLIPKVRKLKVYTSRKHTSLLHRKAVLNFVAQLEVSELPQFFAALLKPLISIPTDDSDDANWFWGFPNSLFYENLSVSFLKYFTRDNIMALSWKKKSGFVHVIEDIVGVFDEVRIRPFLELLMGCVVRLLEWCTENLDKSKNFEYSSVDHTMMDPTAADIHESGANQTMPASSAKQCRDLRSLCLKIISVTIGKYQDDDFGCGFWDAFFTSVKPLIDNFKPEGSSSAKRSSLFSCFVAMSKSPKLVSHLYAKTNLVQDIFSILTIKTASEDIMLCVLEFIENLLVTDSISNYEDENTHKMLLLNLEPLVSSLHFYFQGDSTTKRKLQKCPRERELIILKLLGKYIKDPMLAGKLVDILLPVFRKKFLDTDTGLVAIQIVRDLIPVLEMQSIPKIIDAVCPILVSAEHGLRAPVCDFLCHLAAADHSLREVAGLLRQLNATSSVDIGGLDFDASIRAYGKITADSFRAVRPDHVVLILSHLIYDMSSEEIILRHSAYRSLLSFVDFASSALSKNLTEDGGEVIMTDINDKSCWTEEQILRIINKIIINHLGNVMSKPTPGQKEWVELLQHMVNKLPQVPELLSLKALCNDNAEVDFFNNIIHLQKGMRAKALYRFRDIVGKGYLSMRITSRVFIPMIFNMLFDVQDGKGEHVRAACVDALAAVSGQMEWKPYCALLNRCFREMKSKPDKQKVLLRLVCCILDHFHFFGTSQNEENDLKRTSLSGIESKAVLQKCGSISCSEIQSSLQKGLLPKLQKLLDSDSTVVNVHISLAALKVLKLLPGDAKDSQLPTIIHRISNFLKNRLESVRDDARSALAACLKELGLEYLPVIITTLQSTLKRGFEMHVLGYSVHFILSSCFVNAASGMLDKCLQDLLLIVVNDILGDVSEEKEVEKIAFKMKETRKRKSFETLRLIAGNVTFKSRAMELLAPVTSRLKKHITPKVKSKLEGMLEQIAGGITCNPSIDPTDLFVFVYGLLEARHAEDIDRGDHADSSDEIHESTASSQRITSSRADPHSQCSHLITVFALRVLHTRIQNEKKSKNGQLLSMVDPFVKLLTGYLNSKYGEVIAESLRCLAQLIMLPLPSLEPQAERIKTALLDIAGSSYNTNSPLMESCLRLLTSLLRHTKITLSTSQLHMLIQFPLFIDLEKNPSPLALSLLLAIIRRKLVVHEIYDIVNVVAELIVTTQAEDISKKCRQILLEFLLHYDLKEKRLQQHIGFLLKLLGYEHPSGREAALEMLDAILHKFPKPVLDEWYREFLLHLVQCMANDSNNNVRKMAGMVLKRLFHCVSPKSRNAIMDFALHLYLGNANKMWSIGAQVLGLTVEVLKNKFDRKHISEIMPAIERFLQSAPAVVAESEPEVNSSSVHQWKAAYYSLVLLEKILQEFDGLYLSRDLQNIWSATCNLLSNPHIWLRKKSCRLLYSYFSAVAANSSKKDTVKLLDDYYRMSPGRLFVIAASLCCQLKTLAGDDDIDSIVKQTLTFAICGIHEQRRVDYCDSDGLELFHYAFSLLDPRKGNHCFFRFKSVIDKKNNQDDDNCEDPQHFLISDLLKKMGKNTVEMESFEMKVILETFKAISQRFGSNCKEYAYPLLLPLYKICEGHTGKVIPDDVKQLASEVNQSMREALGIQHHVEVYNRIRKDLKAKRDKRKQQEKVMAVADPTRNAKRKLKLATKNKANKKRKIMTMKFGRWSSN
uniref:ARM repeat superfamily protein n=1 Tax=Kalanchoe fedtschenkoi TaxID=63787 RepID=A0A7N1A2N7_KALFE